MHCHTTKVDFNACSLRLPLMCGQRWRKSFFHFLVHLESTGLHVLARCRYLGIALYPLSRLLHFNLVLKETTLKHILTFVSACVCGIATHIYILHFETNMATVCASIVCIFLVELLIPWPRENHFCLQSYNDFVEM